MDKLKKKKMLIVMVGLVVAASLALCYITNWAKGSEHPANYQCEEKQCTKKPTPTEPSNEAGPTVSFFGIKVSVVVVGIIVMIFFAAAFALFCYAWYKYPVGSKSFWRLTLLAFALFFLFCIFMRQFLPSG